MSVNQLQTKPCVYCLGKGYFQLLLGGSETCPCCNGSGENKEMEEAYNQTP
jgi:DnaJ-class molecular chaperone